MELVKVKYGDLKPYDNNPRFNDEAILAVEESISQVGYISPIIVDENNLILAGHTRYAALYNLSMDEEVEVIRDVGLTEEQKQKYRLLDNKTGEYAEWNIGILREELERVDLGDFNYFEKELKEMADEVIKSSESREMGKKDEEIITCPKCGAVVNGGDE